MSCDNSERVRREYRGNVKKSLEGHSGWKGAYQWCRGSDQILEWWITHITLFSLNNQRLFLKFSISTAELFPERGHGSMVTSLGSCFIMVLLCQREGMFPGLLKARQHAGGVVAASYQDLIRKQQWRRRQNKPIQSQTASRLLLRLFTEPAYCISTGTVRWSQVITPHESPRTPLPPLPNAQRATTDSWNMSLRSQVTIAPSILKINLAWEMSYSIIHCVIFARKLILIQCDKEN